MLEVTAGIIKNEGKYLICQRAKDDEAPESWEFPGGKLEVGETLEQCIIREIKEELNLDVEVIEKFDTTLFNHNDKTIHVTFFKCNIVGGELIMNVHMDYAWVEPKDLTSYDFLPADKDVIERLSMNS